MNDAIQAQNDPALILYKNNIQQLKIPYVQTSALIALILYKNNIQLDSMGRELVQCKR